MIKEMEKENDIMIMEISNMKVIILMIKDMEMGKNIEIMKFYYFKVNI